MQKVATSALYIVLLAMPFSVSAAMFTVDGSGMFKGSPFATVEVHSSAPTSSALFDYELYDLNGNKAAQRFTTFTTQDGQTDCTWDITAGMGPYVLKYGVFSTDWSTLYAWQDNGGTLYDLTDGTNALSCGTAPAPAPSFSTSVSVKDTMAGSATTFSTRVEASRDVSNALIDTELYDASNTKIGQWFQVKNLTAYTPVVVENSGVLPPVGVYSLRVGIFSSDWSNMYEWNANAGSITTWSNDFVPPATPVPPVTPQVTSSVIYYTVDGVQTLKDIVSTNLSNALYDIEVYDAAGTRVFQGVTPYTNTVFPLNGNPLTSGTYTFKVGVFSADWSHLYDWNDAAGSVTFNPQTLPISTLSQTQIQSLLNLLQSFGADSSTVSSFANIFTGHAPTPRADAIIQPISQTQLQSIINLLQSFGENTTIIHNVEEVLSGQYQT